ncbi:MAG: TolB family protein [Planctomycetota bacterium]
MLPNMQTKRSLLIVLMAVVVLASGFTVTAWAKRPDKPPKPPGGGGDPVGTGTIYYAHNASLWSMNPDGSGKILLPVGGVASTTRHPVEGDRWFLQVRNIEDGGFYPLTTSPAEYYWANVFGIDDLETVGFTGDPDPNSAWGTIIYHVVIDSVGDPDTFRWYGGSVAPPGVTGVPITGGNQELLINASTCLTIKFESTTGHVVDDSWWITVKKSPRSELFAVRGDGQIEVQLTDDPNVQPWRPGDPGRALPSWATHDGVVDGKISYLAQRWGKDNGQDVVVDRGLFTVEIEWIDGIPYATTETTMLPVSIPLEPEVLEIPYDWSPDGTQIVYSGAGVWIADANAEGPGYPLCYGGEADWSPVLDDGTSLIAFRIGAWGNAEIRTISPYGGPETTIVTVGKNRTIWSGNGIDWSPEGTHLIYTLIQSKGCIACQYNDSYDIYRVGADGSDSTNLTKDLQGEAFSLGWRD